MVNFCVCNNTSGREYVFAIKSIDRTIENEWLNAIQNKHAAWNTAAWTRLDKNNKVYVDAARVHSSKCKYSRYILYVECLFLSVFDYMSWLDSITEKGKYKQL